MIFIERPIRFQAVGDIRHLKAVPDSQYISIIVPLAWGGGRDIGVGRFVDIVEVRQPSNNTRPRMSAHRYRLAFMSLSDWPAVR